MLPSEAEVLVVKLGKNLLNANLTVRTWGNVSVRVDDTTFAITPSGYAYDSLTVNDIVILDIDTPNTFDSIIRPSSERVLHAEIYKKNSAIQFIIHTHQNFASAIAGSGFSVFNLKEFFVPIQSKCCNLFGDVRCNQMIIKSKIEDLFAHIPVAKYAPSGTAQLALNASSFVTENPIGIVLLPHHGAVIYGTGIECVMLLASILEQACENFVYKALPELHNFIQTDAFQNEKRINKNQFPISSRKLLDSYTPPLYKKIYSSDTTINFIELCDYPILTYLSKTIKNDVLQIPAFVEDFAQIAGECIFCLDPITATEEEIVQSLKNRSAVLLKNYGVLCCIDVFEDMFALKEILKKNCLAFLLSYCYKKYEPLSIEQSKQMRLGYLDDYSKRGEIK